MKNATESVVISAKALIDAVSHRDRPKVSFDRLSDNRYHPFLLFALTAVGPVGCPPRDVPWAFKWMPLARFYPKHSHQLACSGKWTPFQREHPWSGYCDHQTELLFIASF